MTKEDFKQSGPVGRLARNARVAGAMGGLAARLAGQKYLGLNIKKPEHARQLKNALGNLKGPLLKVAQLLATIPEALPSNYVLELQQLQSNAPAMGWPFVKRRMKAELGENWQDKFKYFDKSATAAASLGQVHKAETHDGMQLACKLQYPDMRSTVQADLAQLKLVLNLFERYDKAISTEYIIEEISARLYEELDYKLEAKHTALYSDILKDEMAIHVPHVQTGLSTDRLLTASWCDGTPILSFKNADQETRNVLALNMFRAWYVPLYFYGVIHGDPHPGNYTVREDLSINLLDFGCVRVFPPKFVEGVIMLYNALQNNNPDQAVLAYQNWGFQNLTKDLIDILNIWAQFLYGPILDDTVRPIGEVTEGGGVYGRETAEKVHQELRKIGGLKIPREFVFMDRAALGLGSVFLHLKAEMNWHSLFNELIQGFSVDDLAKRQAEALQKHDISSPH